LISSFLKNDLYFNWLLDKAGAKKSYKSLCEQLHSTEFKWFIPNDDNRIEDGKNLRTMFLDEFGVYTGNSWSKFDCSILELILGISYRLSYETDMDVDAWFWELIDNLNLSKYTDVYYDEVAYQEINKATKKINNRTYKRNGEGGLFPIKNHNEDQRAIEIWYQMSAYLLENTLSN